MSGFEGVCIGGCSYYYLISIGLVIAGSSLLQAAVGFGYALLAFPLLLFLTDLPVSSVTALVGTTAFIQTSWSVWHHRSSIDGRRLLPFLVVAIISLQLGVLTLHAIEGLDRSTIKQIAGAVLLAILIIQYVFSVQPRDRVPALWGIAAFVLFGFVMGIASMGGPFVVLWIMAHTWSNQQIRGHMAASLSTIIPFQVFLLFHQFGGGIITAALWGLLFMPMALLGTSAGLWIGDRIPRKRLRRIAVALLIIIAAMAILHPFL